MFNRKDLLKEVEFVLKTVIKKSTIPVLQGILIQVTDGTCSLSGTDLEIGACSGFRLAVPDFSMVPNGHALRDALKTVKADFVHLKRNPDTSSVEVIAGDFAISVEGYDPLSYPAIPGTTHPGMQVQGETLIGASAAVKASISKDETRFTLNGARLELDRGELRMVATDGHRLSVAKSVTAIPDTAAMLIRSSIMGMLPLLETTGAIRISADENYQYFTSTKSDPTRDVTRILVQRKMEGNFPDWQRVMPDDLPTAFRVNRKGMMDTVQSMVKFTDERSRCGILEFADGAVSVSAKANEQGAKVKYPTSHVQGEATMKIAFNLTYMVDMLRSLDTDTVDLEFKDGAHAMMVKGTAGAAAVSGVIMPMRV